MICHNSLIWSVPSQNDEIEFPKVNPFNGQQSAIGTIDEILTGTSVIEVLKSIIHLLWRADDDAEISWILDAV